MNTKIRITICLILSLSLLFLPACKGGKVPNPSDTPEQNAGQTDATDHLSQTQMTEATQQSQETEGPQQTENNTEATEAAETLDLNWKAKVEEGNLFFYTDLETLYADSLYGRMGYPRSIYLDYEGYEKLKADFAEMCEARDIMLNPFEEVSYSKEFFEEKRLILINIPSAHYEIKNLSYVGGVMVCELEGYVLRRDEPVSVPTSIGICHVIFFEVDADLPEITDIKVKANTVTLSQEEFDQKIKELEERFGS